MHRLILLAFAATLMACAPQTPVMSTAYRSPDAPIYSSATLDEARLIGRWVQVGAFGGQDCTDGAAEFSGAAGALSIAYRLCLSNSEPAASGPLTRIGPGRYTAPGLPGDLWLLWMDADARTLVFGTPSGAYGFVLNRDAALPADRARALREIFDWNGYDLAALSLW